MKQPPRRMGLQRPPHCELLIAIKPEKIVEDQPIYFWVPDPLRNRPNKKLKSPLTKIWGFLKKNLDFWIFLKKIINQKYCSKNHRWYLRLWKKFEKHLLNKFFKNQKLGSSDLDQNVVICWASYQEDAYKIWAQSVKYFLSYGQKNIEIMLLFATFCRKIRSILGHNSESTWPIGLKFCMCAFKCDA